MRRGIGLRGYGGIDPLNEFKREAFKLYEELRGLIRRQVANTIFRVTIQQAPQALATPTGETSAGPVQGTATTSSSSTSTSGDGRRPAGRSAAASATPAPALVPGMAAARQRPIQYQHGDQPAAAASGGDSASRARGDARTKIGRNDPCWCGSGKKFKRCHGA
jgi:preprotein translocase subunit SecA